MDTTTPIKTASTATEADTAVDVGDALQRTSMLATCTISKWSATINDKSVVSDIKQSKGATGEVGRFMKNLLAGADTEYKALNSALDDARACHYRLTLPWVAHDGIQRGPRLLPNVAFEKYAREMLGTHKDRIIAAKHAFGDVYELRAVAAMQNLGRLASQSAYPTKDRVLESFSMKVDFSPVPSGAGFRNLPDNMLYALNQNLNRRSKTMVENAMKDVWTQVRDKVAKLIDRLEPQGEGTKPKVFHDSTITGAKDFLDLMGAFNITNDPKLTEIEQDLRTMLASIEPDQLRNSDTLRTRVHDQSVVLKNKLDQWGV